MAPQTLEALNNSQKFINWIRLSVSLLTRARDLLSICHYSKLKNITSYTLEKRVFIVLECPKLSRRLMMTMRSFVQKFNFKKGSDRKIICNWFEKSVWTSNVANDFAGNVEWSQSVITLRKFQKFGGIEPHGQTNTAF